MEKVIILSDEKLKELASDDVIHNLLDLFDDYATIRKLYYLIKYQSFNKSEIFKKKCPYTIIDKNKLPNNFIFPINHPIDGCIYLSSIVDSNVFYPLSEYHQKLKQEKLNDFLKLCAYLGAKKCSVVSDDSFEMKVEGNIGIGVNKDNRGKEEVKYNRKRSSFLNFSYEFPEDNNILEEYNSLWINGEPSWKTMQDLRLQRGVLKCRAEFNYTDDFGINSNFDMTVKKIGINVGVNFNSIENEKLIFEVEFYPKK